MKTSYLVIAILWLVISVLLGLYISAKGISAERQYKMGLKTILVTYLLGIGFLFAIFIFF